MIQLSTKISRSPGERFYFSPEAWVFLCLSVLTLFVFLRFVDLTPHVGRDFFFSTDDPLLQAESELSRQFDRKDQQLIINIRGDILSKDYLDKVRHLGTLLSTLEGVKSVISLTDGPRSPRYALESPFWRGALISRDQQSSNIAVFIDYAIERETIRQIELLIEVFHEQEFHIRMSGFPYVTELIRRYLLNDMKTFSLAAMLIFGVITVLIFRSARILLGMFISCVNAGMITLMMTSLLDIRIGILTANLATIVFVLTLSHIIFVTFNWRKLNRPELSARQAASEAAAMTGTASFWCMLTTFLGFISLLFVPAKPLRELGISGAAGTVIAFIVAYGVYPAFLRSKDVSRLRTGRLFTVYLPSVSGWLNRRRAIVIAVIAGFVLISLPALKRLSTDPSLLSYFSQDSEIYKGLERIDREGGSSPLVVVVRDRQGKTFNSNRAFEQLWDLQEDLERHPETGTVVSLATLMAQGKRTPFFFLLGWNRFFNRVESPQFDEIGRSFVTPDHKEALYLIRMHEEGRSQSRLKVIEEIRNIVLRNGFVPTIVAGIYALQGRLADLVASSLIFGLLRLIGIFALIGLIVSFSPWTAFAVTLSIGIIPLCILGGFGIWDIPLDIICAPAANVALGMGIDAMIHMIAAYRRLKENGLTRADRWDKVRSTMAEPIMTSMIIITAGFGIFFFSSFPPSQRFGGAIVGGSIVAALTALFIFPLFAGGIRVRKRASLPEDAQPPFVRVNVKNN